MPTWQICVTVVSAAVGVGGLLAGLWTFAWNRKESRHQALAVVLREVISALQQLVEARRVGKMAQELEIAFPRGTPSEEAAQRIDDNNKRYNDLIQSASDTAKKAERELAAVAFRFPDSVRRCAGKVMKDLFCLGQLVNDEQFDAADIQKAKVEGAYASLMRVARGWRLTSPFEAFRSRRAKKNAEDERAVSSGKFHVSRERMELIFRLVHKRLGTQRASSFAVLPPKALVDEPDIIHRDTVIDELAGSNFKVVFQDGTSEVLSLAELMVFVYQVVFLAVQMRDIAEKLGKGGFGEVKVEIETVISIPDIMQPNVVKALLQKVEFSRTPSS
jgi:hypothetical protein